MSFQHAALQRILNYEEDLVYNGVKIEQSKKS